MEKKLFELTIEIQDKNTPQKWSFKNVNQIEQLAIWAILKDCAEKNIAAMLGNKLNP